MLISACKTYTSPRRCAQTKIPHRGLSDGQCVAGLNEINEVCNGLSKRGTRYLRRGTPPVYGETHLVHTSTSQSARPENCRWGSNALPIPEQQVDRHLFYDVCPLVRFLRQGIWADRIACQRDRLANFGHLDTNVPPSFFHLSVFLDTTQ